MVAMQIDDSASHDEIVGFLDYEEKQGDSILFHSACEAHSPFMILCILISVTSVGTGKGIGAPGESSITFCRHTHACPASP